MGHAETRVLIHDSVFMNAGIKLSSRSTNEGPLPWPPGLQVRKGDVLVMNHCSYVDILYLYFRFSPVFTRIHPTKPNLIAPVPLWCAIWDSIRPPLQEKEINDKSYLSVEYLSDRAKAHWEGPIVILPEATTSNGKGLLKFRPVLDKINLKKVKVHVVAIKYYIQNFSPSFTAGSFMGHLFRLGYQWSNTMEVKILLPDDSPWLTSEDEAANITETARQTIAQILRIRPTELSADDKLDFLDYFENNSAKKRKSQ